MKGDFSLPKIGNHWERTVEQAHAHLPPGAKAAIAAILPQLDADGRRHIDELAVSVRRREKQRDSDLRTDQKRRTLVGTRVAIETADRYKALAKAKHISLHQWICDALETAAYLQEQNIDFPPRDEE